MVLINGDDPNCVDVAPRLPRAARRGRLFAELRAAHPRRRLFRRQARASRCGERRIRGAADRRIQRAQRRHGDSRRALLRRVARRRSAKRSRVSRAIARRQEVRGEVRGVTVIDDFGHHPTAIRETLRGLRHRYPGRRLWAIFEPRSNTTRRAVFQQELPDALKLADGVFISQVARLDQIPEGERLNPEAVVEAIAAAGRPAFYEPDVAHIRRAARAAAEGEGRRGDFQQRRLRRDPREVAGEAGGWSVEGLKVTLKR